MKKDFLRWASPKRRVIGTFLFFSLFVGAGGRARKKDFPVGPGNLLFFVGKKKIPKVHYSLEKRKDIGETGCTPPARKVETLKS